MSHPFFDVARPIVNGHRGSAGDRPENTLVSFESALDQGAQILESDIHLSRDGIPILLHDPSLERTTNGQGNASGSTWAELAALDAGSRFEDETGKLPFRGKGVRSPSLEEAFARFPDARLKLAIKSPGTIGIHATLDLVERLDRADRTLLAAGEDAIMRDLRAALETRTIQPALGASLQEIIAAVASALADSEMPPGVMALQIPPTFADEPLVTPELIAHAHANDVQVHVWTVNDLGEIERLLDLGIDGIVTDHPGRMSNWLERVGRR
jgi:glycerophosphoryl diester phosphodiesterase